VRLRKLEEWEVEFFRNEFFDKQVAAGFSEKQKRVLDDGLSIYFPYVPLELQNEYMDKVIESIRSGKYAGLESPTGTGKTLCLLSSTLSYMHYHYNVLKST
jgi:superfamily II DNA or RNA helicase